MVRKYSVTYSSMLLSGASGRARGTCGAACVSTTSVRGVHIMLSSQARQSGGSSPKAVGAPLVAALH